jgi:hypothetical protein
MAHYDNLIRGEDRMKQAFMEWFAECDKPLQMEILKTAQNLVAHKNGALTLTLSSATTLAAVPAPIPESQPSQKQFVFGPLVHIGGVTKTNLLRRFVPKKGKKRLIGMSHWAKELVERRSFIVCQKVQRKRTVILTTEDIGLGDSPTVAAFLEFVYSEDRMSRWSEKHFGGYDIALLPSAAGVFFASQVIRPKGETILVASRLIKDSAGAGHLLGIEYDAKGDVWLGERQITGVPRSDRHTLPAEQKILFYLRRRHRRRIYLNGSVQ